MRKYLSKIKLLIILSIVVFTAEAMVTSLMLYLPGYYLDHYQNGVAFGVRIITIYAIIFALYLLICYLSNRLADWRRLKFERSIKQDFYSALLLKDALDFDRFSVDEYISLLSNDINVLCQDYLSPLISIFRSAIMILIYGTTMVLLVDPLITIIVIVFSAFSVFVPSFSEKELAKRNNDYMLSLGKYNRFISASLRYYDGLNHGTIRSFDKKNHENLDHVFHQFANFRKLNSLCYVLNGGSVEFITLLTFLMVIILLINGHGSVGIATSAILYSSRFTDPLYELSINLTSVKSTKLIQEKILSILSIHKQQKVIPYDANHIIDSIKTVGLTIEYPTRTISYPDLSFQKNQTYLIRGDNGSGKSTLARRIMGLIDYYQGEVYLDDHNVTHADLRDIIAYQNQSTIISQVHISIM